MESRVLTRTRGVFAALAAGALLVTAGCGSSDDSSATGSSGSGGEKGEIVIGATGPLSGPAASLGELYKGMEAKLDEINSRGGIDGNRVKLVVKDDQLNPANTPGVARQLVEGDDVSMMCGVAGSPTTVSIMPYLKARRIALVAAAGSSELTDDNAYLPLPTYPSLAAGITKYAVEDLGKRKVAIAYSDDAVGNPTLAGAKWQLEQMGLEPVAEVKFNGQAPDQSATAAKLKASGADFVVVNNTAPIVASVIRAAAKVGYKPEWGVLWPALNRGLVDLSGGTIDDNVVFASPFPLGDSDRAQTFRDALRTSGQDADETDSIVMLGWVTATACLEVIKRAVEEAGGNKPSREQIVEAMPGMTYSDEYVSNLEWTEENHTVKGEALIVGIRDGRFEALTDFQPLPEAPEGEG
ncbi:ABC transporter substrate-binding protein [Conexibacter stalactiti]|uniref:ABC transporter substrate-binding protein n=1 Tax=Conexibacter stalactiti TaxID=1940611 RepID=A0ABU4HIR5_9ACTN|nr:ABC transporter substrate-binding protein [Conexibacter stalactiti]MDW5593145.1 ABC transporter substrate-binding protein [Conexibacter stalactiti]MEC5033786.1 ABC transporter substrate-binding protein [Conexibacter stalactiti]